MKRDKTLGLLRDQMTGYWGRRLFGQLEYLGEVLRVAPREDFSALLDRAVEAAKQTFEADGGFTKDNTPEIEKILAPVSPELKKVTVKAIGHAHIDMNWMWRFDETVSVAVETFRTMLMLMREYPTFTFAQSQASCYKIVEEYAPELLPEIRQRIQEGRWEPIASTWVEADKNMISGESLSRHLLYTRKYLRDLLGLTDESFCLDFEPDTFGHAVNVPEVLSNAGVKYYYHCRGYSEEILYRWQAPSGASVLCFREPTWYNETITEHSFAHVPAFCARYGMNTILHLFGVGDHGGGATRRDIERLLDMNTWPCFPTVTFGRFDEFYKAAEKARLKTVTGELNFIFTGCYTTETRIKKANRVAEGAMFEAEALSSAASLLAGQPYPSASFETAWQKVLFNHFHDILPGSGVTGTREYALGQFQQAMATATQNKMRALRALSCRMNTKGLLPEEAGEKESIAEGAGVGYGVTDFAVTPVGTTRGLHRLYNLYNPTQYDRHDLAELTVWDWNGNLSQIAVKDEEGRKVPFQLVDGQKLSYWGHEYFRLLVDVEIPGFGYRTLSVHPSEDYIAIPNSDSSRVNHPDRYILENEFVRAEFDPDNFVMASLWDKEKNTELLNGPACFRYVEEATNKGMTAWTVGRYKKIVPLTEEATLQAEAQEGILMTEGGLLRNGFSYRVKIANSVLKVGVTLGKRDRLVHLDVECAWREFGSPETGIPQLQYYLPLKNTSGKALYGVMNGRIEREDMDDDVPALGWGAVPANGATLMMASDSKYGFRSWKGGFSLTLIRSSYNPDTTPEAYDHHFRIGVGPVREAFEAVADGFCHPILPLTVSPSEGELAPKGQFCKAEGLRLTGIKLAEDGSGDLILRGYALAEEIASLAFPAEPTAACRCDIHEQPGTPADLRALPVHNGETLSLRITFGK